MIITNVLLFFIFYILFYLAPESSRYILLQGKQIIQGEALWTLLTSMFMHQGLLHLFVNMFSLFFLGNFCEQLIGKKRFIWLYLLAGLFAGIFFVLGTIIGSGIPWGPRVFGDINAMAAGASGALFGLLGLLAMLVPRYRVYLIVGPIIVFVLLAIIDTLPQSPAIFIINILLNIILFAMIFSLFMPSKNLRKFSIPVALPMWFAPVVAIVPLIVISFAIDLPIGNSAHLGGLLFGLAYGTYLRLKYPQKMLLLKRFFR